MVGEQGMRQWAAENRARRTMPEVRKHYGATAKAAATRFVEAVHDSGRGYDDKVIIEAGANYVQRVIHVGRLVQPTLPDVGAGGTRCSPPAPAQSPMEQLSDPLLQ
jgi:hypothetical protein